MLRQSRCHVLISMTGFGGLSYPAMLDAIAPGWAVEGSGPTAGLRTCAGSCCSTPAGTGPADGVLDVAGLAALGRQHPGAADASPVAPDSPGDILYTSGTTGLPKGVVVTHDAVLRTSYASALTRAYARRPPDLVLAAVLPHVRLRGGAAVGDVRRRRHHPAHGVLARRLLRLDRAAPGHRDPGRADHDGGAARVPRPGRVRPVLADRDLVRGRPGAGMGLAEGPGRARHQRDHHRLRDDRVRRRDDAHPARGPAGVPRVHVGLPKLAGAAGVPGRATCACTRRWTR